MAPVEPSSLNSNAGPLAQLYTQIAVAGTLLAFICGNISNSHRNLPPAQQTRSQHTLHRRGIAIFATLAFIGLLLSAYFAVAKRLLSYREWAAEGGENVPGALWTGWNIKASDGTILPSEQSVWQLGRWMQDTNVWKHGDTLAVESPKAWWWTQQQLAASVVWSAYVGLEARRRNMPTFTTTSFIILSSLVSLSVAQNLFYIALLLSPELPASSSSYDPLWVPYNAVQAVTGVIPSIWIILTPHITSAVPMLTLFRWIVPLVRANIQSLVPKSLGHKFKSASAARRAYTPVFSVLAFFALVMHIKQTVVALSASAPPQPSHFRLIWGTHDTEDSYGKLTRAGIAVGRVLDVLHTHPSVSAIAWDVLLSGMSFCVYAAVRGIDPTAMLKYSLLPWLKLPGHRDEHAEPGSAKPTSSTNKSTSGRRRKSSSSNAITSGAKAVANAIRSPTKRKPSGAGTTGQARRARSTSDDEDQHASVSAANIIDEGDDVPAASTRRSMRIKNADRVASITQRRDEESESEEEEDEEVDHSFIPSPATKRAVSKIVGGTSEWAEESAEAAGEAAALGWGLFVVGGLGVLGSAVLGADV